MNLKRITPMHFRTTLSKQIITGRTVFAMICWNSHGNKSLLLFCIPSFVLQIQLMVVQKYIF